MSKNTICLFFLIYLFILLHFFEYPKFFALTGIIIYSLNDMIMPPRLRADMFIHHCLVIMLSCYGLINIRFPWGFIKLFLETEYSTPFLVFKHYGVRHWVNSVLFLISFSYFRIYKLSIALFFDAIEYKLNVFEYFLVISLYILNLYWYKKILTIGFSMIPRLFIRFI